MTSHNLTLRLNLKLNLSYIVDVTAATVRQFNNNNYCDSDNDNNERNNDDVYFWFISQTDPESTDYVCENGATRNFQAQKLMEDEENRRQKEEEEEEQNNPMKVESLQSYSESSNCCYLYSQNS